MTPRLGWAARCAVFALCGGVLVLPWLRASMDVAPLAWADQLLGWQCHRLPERVAYLGGEAMAVCSRCAGIYAGIGLGLLLARPRWSVLTTSVWTIAALLALLMEALLEAVGLVPVTHGIRAVTGAALAWPLSAAAARLRIGRGGATRQPPRFRFFRRSERSLRRSVWQ